MHTHTHTATDTDTDTDTDVPHTPPTTGTPRLIRQSPMGSVYTAGAGDDAFLIAHLTGATPYEWGLAHGTLLRAEVAQLMPATLAHFQVCDRVCVCVCDRV